MNDTAASHDLLYFDDFSPGQRIVSGTYEMTLDEIRDFASKYDPQPFHMDPEAAKKTVFRTLVASGWHTMAVTMRLLVKGGMPVAGGMVGLGAQLSWPRPTLPGDILQVHTEVVEAALSKAKPDRGTVTMHSETKNQRGEVVLDFTGRLIVPRRPA